MSIYTYCPVCKKRVKVRLLMFGKIQCAKCGKIYGGILNEHDELFLEKDANNKLYRS